MLKRKRLLDGLRREAERMIQGSFSVTTRTCGTPGCGCHSDPGKRHGPHTYLTFKGSAGRTTSRYVPDASAGEAREAVASWGRFRKLAAQVAELNRESAVSRWKAEGRTRRKNASTR